MPIYEYQCSECEHIEEVLQKSTDGFFYLGEGCPNCGSKGEMTRMISVGSFHLKGGGWYKDGYGHKKPKPPEPPKTSEGVTKAKPIPDE
jgi:putative FmdB family regulatory protein